MSTRKSTQPPVYAKEVGTSAFVAFGFCLESPPMGWELKKTSRMNASGSVSLAWSITSSVKVTRQYTTATPRGAYTCQDLVTTAIDKERAKSPALRGGKHAREKPEERGDGTHETISGCSAKGRASFGNMRSDRTRTGDENLNAARLEGPAGWRVDQ